MTMRSRAFAVAALLPAMAGCAHSAIPPRYQNLNDLEAMVAFIKLHPRVAEGLRSIDARGFVVHYGGGCQAEFEREVIARPPGWAGPAAPLAFARSNCPVD